MNKSFWEKKWLENEIGFHRENYHPYLTKYSKELDVIDEKVVFIPLCGKTLDIRFFLEKNWIVIGVELSRIAVVKLFEELGLEPIVEKKGKLNVYSSENLTIYQGDFFELQKESIGHTGLVYDRASLVALPIDMRTRYCRHLDKLMNINTRMMLVSLEYKSVMENGPPFSVGQEEIDRHYGEKWNLLVKDKQRYKDRLGRSDSIESLYVLEKVL